MVNAKIDNNNCKTLHTHVAKTKKCGFIKNKVVECIMKTSVEKATLIPHTRVTHGMDDSNEIGHARRVRSQQHPDVTYKVSLPFTKYVCCTFEWALHGNLCKHQVVFLLMCINFTKENIIQYCGTWYGSNHGGFATMFVDPTYLHLYDNESNNEEPNEDDIEEPWVGF